MNLVESVKLGSPIAEDDNLLLDARVEQPDFWRLLRDEIDIVRGTKGSGKSAMYKLLASTLVEWNLAKTRVVLLKGVEVAGDPIFSKFKSQFAELDETDFQTFWRIYFVSLITANFIEAKEYQADLRIAKAEVNEFRKVAEANNFPIAEKVRTLEGIVKWGLAKVPLMRLRVDQSGNVSSEFDFKSSPPEEAEKTPIFVREMHQAILRILKKSGLRLWLMLDRLDEVFPRRTSIEKTALRALIRTTRAFADSPDIRLKLFIRDDIFDSITDDGFTAMTHVMSRCSSVLRWDKDQIQDLIIKRVFTSDTILRHYQVKRKQFKDDPVYRSALINHILPERVRKGKNQSRTIDWIYKHCEDANGVVTPRDVIDLLLSARGVRVNELMAAQDPGTTLFSPASVLAGHSKMSFDKQINYLKAEFPTFWPLINKFEHQKAEHTPESMIDLLGSDWKKHERDLMSIGFLRHAPKKGTYSIPYLYRTCLHIKRGKANGTGRTPKVAANVYPEGGD